MEQQITHACHENSYADRKTLIEHEFNALDHNNLPALTPFIYPSTGAAPGF
jgi:hypothetical protein